MDVIGIDLGGGTTSVAYSDKTGQPRMLARSNGETTVRSAVFFNEDCSVIVGNDAINAGPLCPSRLVTDWKRHLGTREVLCTLADGQEITSERVAQVILESVVADYERLPGRTVERVVITVPANFADSKRTAVLAAASSAGVDVLFLANEPTCAAWGNQVHERGDGIYAIVDFGASTLDVSVCSVNGNVVEVLCTNGDGQLGGMDYTARMEELLSDEFFALYGFRPTADEHALAMHDIRLRAEQAKHTLSARESAPVMITCDGKVLSTTVTREAFRERTNDLNERAVELCLRTLRESGTKPEELKSIIPVGGASKNPCFHAGIREQLGLEPDYRAEPDQAVAIGGLLLGRIRLEREGHETTSCGIRLPPIGFFSRDITQHAIGVGVLDEASQQVRNAVILKKGVPIPSVHQRSFQLADPGATAACIVVLIGREDALMEDCESPGKFVIDGLDPVFDRSHRIEIELRIDGSAMLHALATDPLSGRTSRMEVAYSEAGTDKNSERTDELEQQVGVSE